MIRAWQGAIGAPAPRRSQTPKLETFVVDATNQEVGVPQKLRVELDVVIHKARRERGRHRALNSFYLLLSQAPPLLAFVPLKLDGTP